MEPEDDPSQEAAMHLLTLPDDVLGLIYKYSDRESKRMLRHSCACLFKSPSVNAQVHSLELWIALDTNIDSLVCQLACFPRNAVLKVLILGYVRDGQLEAFLKLCLQTPEAHASLGNVEELELRASNMDEGVASVFPLMFPNLGTIQLRTEFPSNQVVEVLMKCAPQVKLQSLALTVFTSRIDARVMHTIGSLTGLTSLELDLWCYQHFEDASRKLDISALLPLQQLTYLSVVGFMPVHLERLLSHLPLRHLRLHDASLSSGVNYASRTLQTISLSCLTLSIPPLQAHNFPGLQSLEFGGVDFYDGFGYCDGFSEEEVTRRAGQLAAWVAKFPPSKVSPGTGKDAASTMIAPRSCPAYSCSAAFCASLLSELAPLKPLLSAIQRVELLHWQIDQDGLLALGELFGPFQPSTFESSTRAALLSILLRIAIHSLAD
eukprot:CAMPEP_0202341376 /NCGR_PEP_ID=MMETSP1126-20121109/2402_1 /ASSEMBLY_ACC=CAM_ASM_000457 /TAXON_ID=3047 /ORGANISM="Dunaliella tertiolecta, Strain CCMP1320" /LENGTH=433 /DNA_ID=CAMNT_0048932193 /DNA_START=138 /DNA_END=1440 /DNA_ORIENTATION=+